MNIAIVNDLEIEINALERLIKDIKGYNIIWTARNGKEAIELCRINRPDLILMNLIMPICDGVQSTKIIMKDTPTPIIIISSSINIYQSKIFEAMGYGALDVSSIPINNDNKNDLLRKIDMIAKLSNKQRIRQNEITVDTSSINTNNILLIGASTGGPKVIATILESLPNKINCAIVIVQHLDAQFTKGMVEWLNNYTKIPIKIVTYGMPINNNNIFLVGGNEHFRLNNKSVFEVADNQKGQHYTPSINILFQSFADNDKYKGLAIILTGMGNDGAKGLLSLKKKGWHTLVQDENSSAIYGMPKAAYDLGAADKKLNIEELISEIRKYIINGA